MLQIGGRQNKKQQMFTQSASVAAIDNKKYNIKNSKTMVNIVSLFGLHFTRACTDTG